MVYENLFVVPYVLMIDKDSMNRLCNQIALMEERSSTLVLVFLLLPIRRPGSWHTKHSLTGKYKSKRNNIISNPGYW